MYIADFKPLTKLSSNIHMYILLITCHLHHFLMPKSGTFRTAFFNNFVSHNI